jgi:hypothetical protein
LYHSQPKENVLKILAVDHCTDREPKYEMYLKYELLDCFTIRHHKHEMYLEYKLSGRCIVREQKYDMYQGWVIVVFVNENTTSCIIISNVIAPFEIML